MTHSVASLSLSILITCSQLNRLRFIGLPPSDQYNDLLPGLLTKANLQKLCCYRNANPTNQPQVELTRFRGRLSIGESYG